MEVGDRGVRPGNVSDLKTLLRVRPSRMASPAEDHRNLLERRFSWQ